MSHNVFVNRTLDLNTLRYIGFDMDHTLVRYHTSNFEQLAYHTVIQTLVEKRGYPEYLLILPFEFDRVIRGLVLDTRNGNLLKLNQFSRIRFLRHGTKRMHLSQQKEIYRSNYIDLSHPDFLAIDTSFSVAVALIFGQLVDLKEENPGDAFPSYSQIAEDILGASDEAHRSDFLKESVESYLERYIIRDPRTAEGLERLKLHNKKIFLLTNSHFAYTKLLLDYTITPFLKKSSSLARGF